MKTSTTVGTVLAFGGVLLALPMVAFGSDEAVRCDQIITRQLLSREVDRVRLDFAVVRDEIVRIDVERKPGQTGFSRVFWRLIDAQGAPVPDSDCDRSEFGPSDCGPLDATRQPYFIEVHSDAGDPGDYLAHVQRLTATGACLEGPIGCDVALDGRLEADIDTDLMRIGDVSDGATIGLAVAGLNARFRLIDASGRVVGGTSGQANVCHSTFISGGPATTGPWDCGPLPARGNPYMLEVLGDAGDYEITRENVPAGGRCEARPSDAAPLGCDQVHTLEIDRRSDSDFVPLAFDVTDGEILDVSVLPSLGSASSFTPHWRLIRDDGTAVSDSDCDGGASGTQSCGPLEATGNPYAIEVYDSRMDATGSYRVHVQRLGGRDACEATARCVLDDSAETDLVALGFAAADGQHVQIDVIPAVGAPTGLTPEWRLIDGHGVPAVLADCGDYGTTPRSCGPLLASDNPYRVEIRDRKRDAAGRYETRIDGVLACPTCGNGNVERGEECDLGAAVGCCRECKLAPAGTECRAARGACDAAETCDGVGAHCPVDGFVPASVVCRDARGACDVAERCSGTSPACPVDALAPAGAVCRSAVDECDLAERCTGAGTLCPVDQVGSAIAQANVKLGKSSIAATFVLDGTPDALALDPLLNGFGLQVDSAATGGLHLNLAVPAGAIGTDTHCRPSNPRKPPKDGWKASKDGRTFTYVNRTGAVRSDACAPESALGLAKVKLSVKPLRKDPLRSLVTITISSKHTLVSNPLPGAYTVSLDLGDDAGIGPVCSNKQLMAQNCLLPAGKRTMECR